MAPSIESHDPPQGAIRAASRLEVIFHLLDETMRSSAPRSGPDINQTLDQALPLSSTAPDTDDESFTASSVSGDEWTDIFTTAADDDEIRTKSQTTISRRSWIRALHTIGIDRPSDVGSSRWGGSERPSSNWNLADADGQSVRSTYRERGAGGLAVVEEDLDEDPGDLYDDPSDGMTTEPGDVRLNPVPPTPHLLNDLPGPNTLLNLEPLGPTSLEKGKQKETVCVHIRNGEECTCIDPSKLDQLQKDLQAHRDLIMEIEKDGVTRYARLPMVEVAGVEIEFDELQRKYWAMCAQSHCK
ncbi:hypothetical protein QBC40DRAFT_280716 [Triangularia verruculosa]|uniref:Uncharacterized protein n=1 Tax=Triangularia verruculosa TaxID=2587418 RepID=A0AAN6XGW2_9PEZI|nr:hypothetical protein QBC40DRAFT_280716 [Triangularia verruculosa]